MIFLTGNLRSQNSKRLILLLGFVFLILFVQAQTGVVNNGAKMLVNSGAILKITGTGADYTNTTTGGTDGKIDLDGKIELQGNWINNAVSGNVLINETDGNGEVVFNGSSSQNISGSRASYFEKLTLNNNFGLSLDTNIQVISNLLLTNGIVTLNDNDLTIGLSGTISGGTFGTSKMILVNGTGSLVKSINAAGSFTFPIGENTGSVEYSPVDFTLNSHAGASNSWVSAHVTGAKHPSNNSPSEFLSRYWTLTSSGINTPNYNADFHYLSTDINGVELSIYSAEYDDGLNRSVYSTVDDSHNILSVTGLSTIENTFADYTGVDGTLPTVEITCGVSDPTNDNPIPFTATFSEAVSGFAYTDITIVNGSTSVVSTSDNTVFTFNVVPTSDGEVTIDIDAGVCTDIAGNDNVVADQFGILYDSTQPNVNLTTTANDPTNLSPFTVKVQFTEKVSGFILGDISVTNGTAGNLQVLETDSVFTVDITPGGDGAVDVDINAGVAVDAAGNTNIAATTLSINYDGTVPTVSITSSESSPTNANPIPITITFSETVTGFALSDINVGNGAAGALTNITPGKVWTAEITPTNTAVTVDIAANIAIDAAGNNNTAASQFSITYDGTAPTVAITSTEPDPTNASFSVSIHFNEVVTGFAVGDVTVSNCTKGAFAGTGQDYTLDITPLADGIVTVNIDADVATDAAGNNNTAADKFSITYDGTLPDVEITSTDPDPTNSSFSVSIHFDESVTGFDIDDVVVGNGTKGTFAGSGQNYTLDITPTSDGSVTVDIAAGVAVDAAGNGNTIATQFAITYDVSNPTVAITSSEVTLTNANPIPITITFNEDVSGFILEDITVVNGTAGNLVNTTPNRVWTAQIIPDDNGIVTVDINADIAQDDATNGNTAATQFSITYDGAAPTVAITSAESDPTNASFTVSIHFNETVTGFDVGDVTVSNCTKGTFTPNGNGQDWTLVINPTIDGIVTVDIDADVATDAAGNGNTVADQYGITYDASNPTILTYNPADEATGVTLSTNLEINFDEVVVAGTGKISLYKTSGDALVQEFDVTSDISGSGTTTITINPTSDLESLVDYYVQIATTAFDDEAGNSYAGITDKTTWNFTAVDASFPEITTLSPADNASDVVISSNLVITFDEIVTANTGNINLYKTAGDVLVQAFDVTSDISGSGTTIITINPTSDLLGETDYYVLIDATAFVDASSNAFAGISNPTTWSFTTEDIAAPTVDALTPADDATNIAINSDLVITFNENVVKGSGNIIITNATTASQHESIDVTSGQVTISSNIVTINPSTDFNGESNYYVEIASGVFKDESANNFAGISGASTWNYTTEDVLAPTVVVSTAESSPTNSSPFSVTITFSEQVQNFVIGDISVTNGVASALSSGDDITYTVNITPDADATVSVVIPAGLAEDLTGNANEVSNQLDLEYDSTSPTLTISTLETDPMNSSPFEISIKFSEEVSGFDASDITVGNGVASNVTTSDNITFTADITPTTDGTVTIDVAADVAIDAAGNGNTIATQLSVTYDSASPTVVISTVNNPTNTSPFEVNIVFNEEVNGFELGDITVGNGAASNLTTSDSITFTADITPVIDGAVTIDVAVGVAIDAAGNGNAIATQLSITYDSTSPTVVISTVNDTTNASPFQVTITFNEEVQNFEVGDISVTNGTAGNLLTGDNITYTADITPGGELTVSIEVTAGQAQDLAGNGNEVSNKLDVVYDASSPTVEITSVQSGTINTDLDITITFNEEITDLAIGNITVVNGTVSTLTNSTPGTVWDATINPTTNGTVTVDVLVDEVVDIAGNGNTASNQFTIDYDGSAPTISVLSPTDDSTDVDVAANLYITFNEEVNLGTGYVDIRKTVGDGLIEHIPVVNVSGDGTKIITINPVSDFESEVEYYVLIDAGAFTDLVGNDFAGISSTTDWSFTAADIIAPTYSSLSPADDASDVLINSDLVITFTENVIANVGNITIKNDDTGQDHEIIDVTSGQVSISNNVVTINPSIDFVGQTNYHVLVTESSYKDGAGNYCGGINTDTEWSFFTEDKNAPVATFSPNNVMGVSVASNLQITFDETVVANTGNITIMNKTLGLTHEIIPITSANVSITNNIVVIDPTSNFDGLSNYYILIDDGALEDVLGNAYGGISDVNEWYFTTADASAPVITSLTPADNASDVSVSSDMEINFNENVFANTGNITIMNATTSAIHEIIDVTSVQVSISNNVVTINPTLNFDGETDYYVLVDSAAFEDAEANAHGGIIGINTWNFTTEDITNPIANSFSPIDGAIDVSVIANLEITFSENIFANIGNITIMNATTGTIHETIDITSGEVSISGNVLSINPSSDFIGSNNYYVLIASTAIRDFSGNNYAGISNNTDWNFTVVDATNPIVSALSPLDNSIGINVTSDLQITFSKTVFANTGNITIYNATTSANHEVFDVSSSQVTIDANVVTINPSSDFDGLSDYYVLIADGAFRDVDANAYAGMQSNSDWNFTTADASAPVVDLYTPLDGATGVSVSANLILDFNETVVANTGNITIYDSNDAVYEQIVVTNTGQVSISDDIVTINPSIDFVGDEDYYVLVDNGAFRDVEAIDFGGIADATTWNFSTEDKTKPTLVSRIPVDNATSVSTSSNLVLTFDEDIFANAGNITIYDSNTDSIYEQITVPSALVTISTNTVTIDPAIDLVENTAYYVLIAADVFRDANGNGFDGIAGITTWNFVSDDITLPTISTLSPADDATGVSISSDLKITFSEPVVANTGLITIMDASSIHESISVLSTQVSIASNVVTINPGIDFNELSDYYVLIDAGAFHDESGNSFAGISDPTTWNFKTGDFTPPSVTITPAKSVNANGDFDVTVVFSELVTGFTSDDITLGNASVGTFTESTAGLIWTVTIKPVLDGDVTIDIAAGVVTDIAGNANTAATTYTVEFDATAPTVAITSSATGTVSGNFDITVTFSEPVIGFTSGDITVANATLGTFTESTPGLIWTVTIEPIASGDVTINIAAGVVTDIAGNNNTAASQFGVVYDSGVGFEDVIPYEISIYSFENRVIVKFTNEGNYKFNEGVIEIYNLLGQKIIEKDIDDFVKFETELDYVSQIYLVKVVIDGTAYVKRLYIK